MAQAYTLDQLMPTFSPIERRLLLALSAIRFELLLVVGLGVLTVIAYYRLLSELGVVVPSG